MKRFLQVFALMAVFLMGSVTMEAGKVLTYDFMTNHPSTTIRIDQGYKEVRGNFVYWTGAWAGLFGNKIAFDATSAYPSLRAQGGLCDYHDHQKMYIMNLNSGDKVTFYYTGTNAAMQFHISSTCSMAALTANFDPITSGVAYTVNSSGNLCVLNKWKKDEAETIITRIVIESAKEYEQVDLSNGMCTFCSTVPLDFTETTNLKAFVATGYDNGKFIFKEVKYVPSDTGFLIVSQGGSSTTANVPVGRSSNYRENAISNNLFNGSLGAVNVIPTSGKKYYIFAVADGEVGIYKMNNTFRCQANKAYLVVDN
jgi:hypothetical protein